LLFVLGVGLAGASVPAAYADPPPKTTKGKGPSAPPHPPKPAPAPKPPPAAKDAPKSAGSSAPPASSGASPPSAHEVVKQESRIEFDERMVKGQSAAGAIFLFQRAPSDFKSIVDVPDSFRAKTVELVQPRRGKP